MKKNCVDMAKYQVLFTKNVNNICSSNIIWSSAVVLGDEQICIQYLLLYGEAMCQRYQEYLHFG